MLKLILQMFAVIAVFVASCYVLGFLMPIFTHPIVFTVFVAVVGFLVVKIAVRS